MTRRTLILHIGAGKCGSSALQQFLTQNSIIQRKGLSTLHYYSITKPYGLVLPEQHRERSRHVNHRFINSISYGALFGLERSFHKSIAENLAQSAGDVILSSEGWFQSFQSAERITGLLSILDPGKIFDISILAFIRAPVKWINSAWWQWGAWSSTPFQQWIDDAITAATWINTLSVLKAHPRIKELHVLPLGADIVQQFCAVYGPMMKVRTSAHVKVNTSLPAEVCRLYQQEPSLRGHPHISGIDFSILSAISESGLNFRKTPWVLSSDQISKTISETYESNVSSLALMQTTDRDTVLADAAWWDESCYEGCVAESPNLDKPLDNSELLKLAYVFAHGLHRARLRASKAGAA